MPVTRREVTVTYAALAVLLLVFTFLDLRLSLAVYRPESLYGRIFEAMGEAPGMLISAFSAAVLLMTRDKSHKVTGILSIVGFGLLTLLTSVMAVLVVSNYITDGQMSMPLVVVAGTALCALLLLLASRLEPAQRVALRRAAIIGILLMLSAALIVNLVKVGWGRPRFRSMTDPLTQFTPWYAIQGMAAGEEFKSFPSGHTANAAVVLWLSLLPSLFPRLKGRQTALYIAAWVWIALVAFSRVVMGAHFATDVIVAATITYSAFVLLRVWQYRGRKAPLERTRES